jgi:hypothetical protein
MAEDKGQHCLNMFVLHNGTSIQCSTGNTSSKERQIGAQGSYVVFAHSLADPIEYLWWADDSWKSLANCPQRRLKVFLLRFPLSQKRLWVRIEPKPSLDDAPTLFWLDGGLNINNQSKSIEELWPQATFLRVHAAEKQKLAFLRRAEPFALQEHHSARRHVEE